MNYSGEAAEQVVRMSLNGIEVAAKISGKAAERLAVLIFAIWRDQKKTKGKTRLANMLRNGKELKVFGVMDSELQLFCEEAKKYGVLYCVLKDRNAKDGFTDILVQGADAGKVNRIFERFSLSSMDVGTIQPDIQREFPSEELPVPERTEPIRDKVEEFLDGVVREQPNPTAERNHTENPTSGRTTKSHRSEPSYARRDGPGEGAPERPSVRRELEGIRSEQRRQPDPVKNEKPLPNPPKKEPKEVHK